MKRFPLTSAILIGGLLTLLIDVLVEAVFFNHYLDDYWLSESILTSVFVISAVILVSYSIPGYVAARIGRKGREISTGVIVAFLATPIIAYLSIGRAPSDMAQFNPTQILVYFGVALSLVIGSIFRGIQTGTFRGKND